MDAALTWKFSRELRLTAGQFKIPFSAESLAPDNFNIPIARARAVNALAPGRDTGVQGRDSGLQLSGTIVRRKTAVMDYAFGVFRGQTFLNSPDSHFPAAAGRVMLHPVPAVTVGGDWYGSFSAPARAEKRRVEIEGSYEQGRFRVRAEQIWARDGALERRGGYIVSAVRVSARWEPLIRADWLTKDVGRPDAASAAYIGGSNFYWGQHVKLSANAGTQHDQGPKGFSSVFLAQAMLLF